MPMINLINAFLNSRYPIIILTVVALITRFAFLSYPAEVVFDEVYFGKFVSAYFDRQYYFDIHPPLGKLIIAGLAALSGFKPGFDFSHIGEGFDAQYLFILRFLPALFSSFFPLVIYLLLMQLGATRKTAFLGAFLTVFDNAVLGQSKFILLDIFLLFFGFLSLHLFLKSQKAVSTLKSYLFLAAAATSAIFSASIKWTGLSFLALLFLMALLEALKRSNIKKFFLQIAILLIVPFIIYCLVFLTHFSLLSNSGSGDAYMSYSFQQSLKGIGNMSFWQKFSELNKAMYQYNVGLKATHAYGSKWYQWPLDARPIWYWTKTQDGNVGNIYLFANPLTAWLVLIGVIIGTLSIFIKNIRKKLPPLFYILLLGYFGNLLPYLAITRVAFLYHYLPSLVFGILMLAILYEKIIAPKLSPKNDLLTYGAMLSGSLLFFILFAPLTYGFLIPINSSLNHFYNFFITLLS